MAELDGNFAAPSERQYVAAMSRPEVVQAYAEWDSYSVAEELCLSLIGHDKLTSIVDLGCGAGRLARRLASISECYVGIDSSAPMIDVARLTAPRATFFLGDMVSFPLDPESFTLALVMHNSLDNLAPESRRRRLIENCYHALIAGGHLIVSSHTTDLDRQKRGYYQEDYHGTLVSNFRTSLAEFVSEVEAVGLRVDLAVRDFRGDVSDWAYLVATKP